MGQTMTGATKDVRAAGRMRLDTGPAGDIASVRREEVQGDNMDSEDRWRSLNGLRRRLIGNGSRRGEGVFLGCDCCASCFIELSYVLFVVCVFVFRRKSGEKVCLS